MMKKTGVVALMLAAMCSPVLAGTASEAEVTETVVYSEDKYKVETNGFWDNWFVSAGAGAQIFFGDHDRQVAFGKRLSPALDIAVGKWFTPGVGFRLMYSGLSAKGATQKGHLVFSEGVDVPGKGGSGYWLEKQKFCFFDLHVDALFNISNIIWGYKEDRIYNCSPYAGIGLMRITQNPHSTELVGQLGILNSFRITSYLDINLDIRAMMAADNLDYEVGGRKADGMLTASVGLTYKFNKRNWDRPKTIVREIRYNDEINALRAQLQEAQNENDSLKSALDAQKQVVPVVLYRPSSNLVVFAIGKSTLSNESRVNLGMMAEAIKAGDSNTVYTITGYADAGTGSKAINERLSRERAEAVYNCLVNEFGIDGSRLQVEYKGGVKNMYYNDPCMSRAVITRVK